MCILRSLVCHIIFMCYLMQFYELFKYYFMLCNGLSGVLFKVVLWVFFSFLVLCDI